MPTVVSGLKNGWEWGKWAGVLRFRSILLPVLTGIFCLVFRVAQAENAWPQQDPGLTVLISVADQKLVLLRDGGLIAKYPVSTSRFGVGDSNRSYKTPVGRLRVYNKIGDDLPAGAVIKHREATGEVVAVDAPGRDTIVTREIWLEGLEDQNANAKGRAIYIHGTPEERFIGKPVSWGCIRMRSEDVIALYDQVGAGTQVDITEDRLPHLHKYRPPPPPPPPQEIAPEPEPAPIAKADVKTNSKPVAQASSQPQAPAQPQAVAEKPLAERAAAEKTTAHTTISHVPPPAVAFHAADSGWTPKNSYDPDAWRAMKGSIIMSGLPGSQGPAPVVAPKAPPVTGQQVAAQVK